MLSRLVIAFLPRSKCLFISWMQSPSAVILEPKNIVCHCFHCFPIFLPGSDRTGCHDLRVLNVELSGQVFVENVWSHISLQNVRLEMEFLFPSIFPKHRS